MRIAFYYAFPGQKDWNGADLEGSGLAGSETALVHLSRELAKRHCVTVFNATSRAGVFGGVEHLSLSRLDYNAAWDAFIAVRGPVPDLARIDAPVKLYWSIEEDGSLVGGWERVLPHVQAVVTISPFHTRELVWRCGLPPSAIWETRLGVSPDEYAEELPKVAGRLIYCSVPGRGLAHLANAYRLIRREAPEASLVITSDYSLWGQAAGTDGFRRLFRSLPGVTYLGRIPRAELVRQQKASVLHLYPCSVAELFCLPAIECQAAGAPTIATDLGALASTVADGCSGVLIRERPDSLAGEQALARAAVSLLRDPARLAALARQARERALAQFGYPAIAAEWERQLAYLRRAGRARAG